MAVWLPDRRATGQIRIEFAELADAKEHGYSDRIVTIDLLTCCHCGRDFKVSRGSKTQRGFCMRHGAVTCGNHACDRCPLSRR